MYNSHSQTLNRFVRMWAPPVITDAARQFVRKRRKAIQGRMQASVEQDASYYDAHVTAPFTVHYTQSHYYFFWSVIADRIFRGNPQCVLDIGCGTGQFAPLLRDKGLKQYCGFDFSPARIEHAKKTCPKFEFAVADAYKTKLLDTYPYDTVVCMEFLEHVERDIDVLRRIRPGTHFLGSVPNFPDASHVRHFHNCAEVADRYQHEFEDFSVDFFFQSFDDVKYFVFEGTKR